MLKKYKGMFRKIFDFMKISIILVFYFTLSLYAGALLLILRFILRPFKSPRQRFTKMIKRYWLNLTMSVCSFYLPHPIYVAYNKDILKKKRCLIVSNHLTNFDWIIIMVVLNDLGMYNELCVIMKYSLSKLPIYGYGMKCFDYIFLKRRWQDDIYVLSRGLEKLKTKNSFFLLFFPEGTTLCSEALAKSQKFSLDENIKVNSCVYNPQYSLIPRVRGINKIYDVLKDKIDCIIDITLFITPYKRHPADHYDYNTILFSDRKKPQFYMVLDEYKENISENWLYKIFYKKDKVLQTIFETKTNIETIQGLAEFSNYFRDVFKKKFNYFDKKIWSSSFYVNICLFFCINILNIHIIRHIYRIYTK